MSKYLHGTTGIAVYSVAAVVAAAILAAIVARAVNQTAKSIREYRNREDRTTRNIATPLYILAAMIGTALSTNTSWRFFRKNLGFPYKTLSDRVELIGMFSGLEVILVACAFGARQNLNNPEKKKGGAPGVVVWLVSGLAAIPAYSVGGSFYSGTWRVLLGPLMAVFAFHGALGMELRHKSPKAQNESFPAVVARELTKRLYARLGLATRDRTALDMSQDRALTRAVILYGQLSAMSEEGRDGRRGVRRAVRLREQLRRAGVHDNLTRMDLFLSQAAVYQHTGKLFDLTFSSPWTDRPAVVSEESGDTAPTPEPVVVPGHDTGAVLPVMSRDTTLDDDPDDTTLDDTTTATDAERRDTTPVVGAPVSVVAPAMNVAHDMAATSEPDDGLQVAPVVVTPVVADSRAAVVPPQRAPSVAALVRELIPQVGDDTMILQKVISERVGKPVPEDTIRTARRRAAKHAGPRDNSGPYL